MLLTRKRVLDEVGPWDTGFVSVADWDMCVRVSRRGEIRFLDRILVGYRRHNGNISSNVRRNVVETRQLHHKTFFSPENDDRQRQIVRDGWKAWQAFKIREKVDAAATAMKGGRPVQAAKFAGHVLIHGYRYVRGYPTPQGV